MKYLKRYNKFYLQTNCRICLTQSVSSMVSLKAPLKDTTPRPLVHEALEYVMNNKISLDSKYPTRVCAMCIELLKIAYDLKGQYCESQKYLGKLYPEDCSTDTEDYSTDTKEDESKNKALVELVVGNQKFNINDLVIVEEDNESEDSFEGFLQNLGTSISASFVSKGHKKKENLESPSLVIEKVVPDENNERNIDTDEEDTEENLDLHGNEDNCEDKDENLDLHDNDDNYEDTEENLDVHDNENNYEENDIGLSEERTSIRFLKGLNQNDKGDAKISSVLNYKCPFCQKPMSSLNKIQVHSVTCEKNVHNAKCYICNKKFRLRRHLLNHMKKIHFSEIKKVVAEKLGKYKCTICNIAFRNSGSLTYHMRKHTGKQYTCDECGKLFYTTYQVAIHKQSHNREKTLVLCPVCGKGFHYQSGLFYHMKLHNNERNYQCNYCPRKFYSRTSIKRHELTHTGGRPYSCKYCEKKFRSMGEVKKHQYLHTGERPYMCKYCDMGFTQSHNLKLHLTTHPGNIACPYCPKAFPESEILSFHLQNKHKIKSEGDNLIVVEEEEGDEGGEMIKEMVEEGGEAMKDREEMFKDQEDEVSESDYFVAEEYDDNEQVEMVEEITVRNYEVRDQVLIETLESGDDQLD